MPANPAGTRIVQNELEHPGPGLPVASGRTVTAKLNGPGFIDGGTREKVFTREAVIDPATGLFQLILEVNADIDPAGTSWIVKEPGNRTWTIQVPAGDPTVPVTLRACLVADPTNPNPIQAGVSEAELAAFEATLPGTYAHLDGSDRLAINGVEITPAEVGADPAGAAAGLALVFGA